MGIFDALNTAVGGLQAQSFALQNISGNIANASTIGYKGIDTTFEDLIAGRDDAEPAGRRRRHRLRASRRSPPQAPSRHRPSRPTWRSTATASSRCRRPPARSTTQPVFNGVTDYTRARRFSGQCQRQSGQWRRILSDGRRGRSEDRKPDRQRSAGPAVPEQLRSGAGHHARFNMPQTFRPCRSPGEPHRAPPARSPRPAALTPPISRTNNPLVAGHAGDAFRRQHRHRRSCLNQAATPAPITTAHSAVRHRLERLADRRALSPATPSRSTARSITFVTSGATGNQPSTSPTTIGTVGIL